MLLLEYQQQLILYYILHNIYYQYFEFPKKNFISGIKKCKELNCYSLSSFNYTLCGLFLMRYPLKNIYFQSFYPYFLCIQGILCYTSESVYIHKIHWSHSYNETVSKYNTLLALYQGQYYYLTLWQCYIFFIGFTANHLALFYMRNKHVNPYMKLQIIWRFTIPLLIFYTIYSDNTQLLIAYNN